jgi:PIN domain nuclease of toxin-antitoxin system
MWLFEGSAKRLSKAAQRAIDKSQPLVSAAAVYELEILYERGKRHNPAKRLLDALSLEIGLQICSLPFRTVVEHAIAEAWSRDPIDRLIVANAKAAKAPLVTADEKILRHYSRAIW